jgi:hypothetical protein
MNSANPISTMPLITAELESSVKDFELLTTVPPIAYY